MSFTYQEGFKDAAGDSWVCTPSLATKEGDKYVYSGTLTPAQVNSPDFNITLADTAGPNGAVVDINNIQVRIIYTVPVGSSTQTGRAPPSFADVAYGTGANVVICGGQGLIQRSTDNGATWALASSGTAANLRRIKWDGNQFIAVGDAGTIITSPDGITWTRQNSGATSSILGITVLPGEDIIIVGAQDIDRVSSDRMNWR